MELETFVLHGFLGTPKDWSSGIPIDLLNETAIGPEVPLQEWGALFNKYIKRIGKSRKRKLIGYSMGGRLALHALRADPEFWREAVIMSAHPGLVADQDKKNRLSQDNEWAERFLQEPWDQVLKSWNEQAVFQHDSEPSRREEDYDRKKLALCLRNWSLGHQKDFRPFLATLNTNWLAMTGEKDAKFTELWKSFVGPEHHMVVRGAGHRLLFQPATCRINGE